MHEIVASGEIGRPCILRITNRDPDLPALEFMPRFGRDVPGHDHPRFRHGAFKWARSDEVYALGGVLIDPALNEFGDIDTNIVTLKFVNGAIGAIDNSRRAVYGYDQRLEVFCSNGTAMAENEVETTIKIGAPDRFGSARPPYFFMQRYAPCYIEEVRQFIECVRDDKPTPTTGADGHAAVVLGYAAAMSLRRKPPGKGK